MGGNGGFSSWDLKAVEEESRRGQGSLSEGCSPRPPWHDGVWVCPAVRPGAGRSSERFVPIAVRGGGYHRGGRPGSGL